jgi:hypothetical protein
MEMTDKTLSEKESLDLISQMLRSARTNLSENSFYYLFWGWLVFISALIHFGLMKMGFEWAPAIWILMPLGAVVTIIYSSRQNKQQTVKTHIGRVMGHLWLSLGVAFLITLICMNKIGLATYPVMMILYGVGLFSSGGALRFKPLLVGAVCCWIAAVVAIFQPFEIQLLCLAFSVLAGYIIPGHMLKASDRYEAV